MFNMGYQQQIFDIPLNVLPENLRQNYNVGKLTSSIAKYVDLVNRAEKKQQIIMPWPVAHAVYYASKSVRQGQCISAWQEFSQSDVVGMIEKIKTKILEFALKIEAEAPDAGSIVGIPNNLTSEKITQLYTYHIQGNIGVMQTGSEAIANIDK